MFRVEGFLLGWGGGFRVQGLGLGLLLTYRGYYSLLGLYGDDGQENGN